jgi:hypothetical protein
VSALPQVCVFLDGHHALLSSLSFSLYLLPSMVLGFELKLSHTPNPFCFSCFSDKVLWFWLGLPLDLDPPAYASPLVGITDMYHHAQLIC